MGALLCVVIPQVVSVRMRGRGHPDVGLLMVVASRLTTYMGSPSPNAQPTPCPDSVSDHMHQHMLVAIN